LIKPHGGELFLNDRQSLVERLLRRQLACFIKQLYFAATARLKENLAICYAIVQSLTHYLNYESL
jgi:hypothetical protein